MSVTPATLFNAPAAVESPCLEICSEPKIFAIDSLFFSSAITAAMLP